MHVHRKYSNARRRPRPARWIAASVAGGAAVLASLSMSAVASAATTPFISPFTTTTTLASTVPANGDQNPYGIVVAPATKGKLTAGNILVSNFNNEGPVNADGNPTTGGNQGQGTTIVQFNADGSDPRLFAQINASNVPGGVGLTTALSALPNGDVVVGSLPTTDGTSATATKGELIFLNANGHVIESLSGGPISGPWDMTSLSIGPLTELFVTNVLNHTVASSPNTVNDGTVVRLLLLTLPNIKPIVLQEQTIATGFAERTDPAALVVGPTGVGLSSSGTLYVADSVNNRIAAVPDAIFRSSAIGGGGKTVTTGGDINDPLGLTIAPNGDILSANGGDGNLVETTPGGQQVAEFLLDDNNGGGGGDLFGITVPPSDNGVLFVNDFDNTLRLFH